VTAVLKDIIGKIQHALAASTESSGSLAHIGTEVTELVQAFAEIASSTGELAEGGREMLQASQSLMQVTENIRSGSVEMNRGAERISRAHSEIARISGLSRAAMDDVAHRAADIDADISLIAAMSAEGRRIGQQLNEAVGRFTVREDMAAARSIGLPRRDLDPR
jgi:methyl-accepting chemotaxis protein